MPPLFPCGIGCRCWAKPWVGTKTGLPRSLAVTGLQGRVGQEVGRKARDSLRGGPLLIWRSRNHLYGNLCYSSGGKANARAFRNIVLNKRSSCISYAFFDKKRSDTARHTVIPPQGNNPPERRGSDFRTAYWVFGLKVPNNGASAWEGR